MATMKLKMRASSEGPWRLGANQDLVLEIADPSFNTDKAAWATQLIFHGSETSRDVTIYGETALQSLMLATQFAMRMYEPEILGE